MDAAKTAYRAVTRQIEVTATPRFLPEQSDPEGDKYLFAYKVRIVNSGEVAAQLLSRHWIITDANQHVEEVRAHHTHSFTIRPIHLASLSIER